MKKTLVILLSLVMMFSLIACGEKEAPQKNEIADLFDQGFEFWMTSMDPEQGFFGLMQKGDDISCIYKVFAEMTEKQYEEYDALRMEDGKEEEANDYLCTLSGVKITDVTDRIPTQDELNQYVGKTFADLEDDGFYNSGYSAWDEACTFYFDGPLYYCTVTPTEKISYEEMDDYSPNDIRALEIKEITFNSFAFGIFEE